MNNDGIYYVTNASVNYPKVLGLTNSNTSDMKETKLTKHKVIFEQTTVTTHEYNILAESFDDAKKKIEEGGYSGKETTVSIEVKDITNN